MYLRKISIILLVILFVSCDGFYIEKRELNNERDEAIINQTVKEIDKSEYQSSVSNLTTMYSDRIKASYRLKIG